MALVRNAVVFRIVLSSMRNDATSSAGVGRDSLRDGREWLPSGESHARSSHVMARRCVSWHVVIVSPVTRPGNRQKTSSSPSAMKLKLMFRVSRDDHDDEARRLDNRCAELQRRFLPSWRATDARMGQWRYRWKSSKSQFQLRASLQLLSATNNMTYRQHLPMAHRTRGQCSATASM